MQKYAKFIISGLIILVAGSTYSMNIQTPEQIIAESIRKSNIEINIRNQATIKKYKKSIIECTESGTGSDSEVLEKLSACINRPKPTLEKTIPTDGNSNSGEMIGNSGKILDNAKDSTDNTKDLRLQICKKIPNSPLCNEENYTMARAIAYKKALIWGIADREYFFRVGIGIMNSESTLGTKYAGTCDQSYNNFGGIKYRILDTGKAVHDQPIPQNGCWMYKFATMEDYFGSKYNSLGKGYGKCFGKKDAVHCIAFSYVGDPKVAEQSWQNNVNTYAK